MTDEPRINPDSRIGEILDRFPELEEVLIGRAAVFAKLRNPVLRRTVAKVATVEKAAAIAGIPVRDLVRDLREAVGQEAGDEFPGTEPVAATGAPAWYDPEKVERTLDAQAMLDAGEIPIGPVTKRANELRAEEILLVLSGFRPEPLIETLEKQGFRTYAREAGPERWETFVIRG